MIIFAISLNNALKIREIDCRDHDDFICASNGIYTRKFMSRCHYEQHNQRFNTSE